MEDDGIKTYEITGGADQLVQPEITKEIVIRSDAPFDKFDKAMINGLVIDPKYYTVTKGSTVITLNADFIEKIPAGTHVFGIISKDGVALTSFTVEEKPTEDKDTQTGDNSHILLWFALLLISSVTVIGMANATKKKKRRKN